MPIDGFNGSIVVSMVGPIDGLNGCPIDCVLDCFYCLEGQGWPLPFIIV